MTDLQIYLFLYKVLSHVLNDMRDGLNVYKFIIFILLINVHLFIPPFSFVFCFTYIIIIIIIVEVNFNTFMSLLCSITGHIRYTLGKTFICSLH